MASEQLLLIVLTKAAKQQLSECGLDVDALKEHLCNLDNIQLFKYPDKKKPDEPVIALPIGDGRHAMLCKQDTEERNYLVCIAIIGTFIDPDTSEEFCHELPSDVICWLLDNSKKHGRYQSDAVISSEICNEVLQKEFFRSSNEEERKWQTYLDLFDKITKSKAVNFSVTIEKLTGKKLTAVLNRDGGEDASVANGDLVEQIEEARSENVRFHLIDNLDSRNAQDLGRLISVNKDKQGIEIDLEKSFQESLSEMIKRSGIFVTQRNTAGEKIAVSVKVSKTLPDGAQEYTFYQNSKPSFKANAILTDEESEEEHKVSATIERSSIAPLRLNLSIDYLSELYQIGVMKRRFEETKKLPVWEVLSGKRVSELPADDEIALDNPKLNDGQRKAIKGALNAKELFSIWGPPGTGKTEVIKEITKQAVLRGERILICSQSNLAVDNAIARIGENPETYPFRIAKDSYEMEGEDVDNVPFWDTSGLFFLKKLEGRLKSQADLSSLQKTLLGGIEKSQKVYKKTHKSESELREILQHAKLYKKHINIVGSTLMIAGRQGSRPPKDSGNQERKSFIEVQTGIKKFDRVIIDEVSKATPPELFIPIPLAGEDGRIILVGDYMQLPPMFKMLSGDDATQEEWADEAGIEKTDLDIDSTIFERLWKRHEGDASAARAMLTTQYRMHPSIEKLIQPFYKDSEGQLSCGLSEEEIKDLALDDLSLYKKYDPCMWLGTKGSATEEKVGTSFVNLDEIEKVGGLLSQLSKLKDKTLSVGVITFYGAQLRELRDRYEGKYKSQFGEGKLVFGTVDRFQGRECDVIICSFVRNNKVPSIGFASKPNRINVALSRARKALIILGSKQLFCYENPNQKATKLYKEISKECMSVKPKDMPDEQ